MPHRRNFDPEQAAAWATAAMLLALPAAGVTHWDDPSHWLALALAWAFVQAVVRPQWFERFVPPAKASTLGGIRAWTCLILLVYAVTSDLPRTARLPREMLVDMGLISRLHRLPIGFSEFLTNEPALAAFQALTIVALALGVIGLFTRVVVPVAAVCSLLFIGIFWHYAYFYHQCMMALYVLCALSLTPCGDGFSLDAWLARRRGRAAAPSEPTMVYGWSRYLCWIALVMPYQLAGMSKLRFGGWMWWDPANLRSKILTGLFEPGPFERPLGFSVVDAPDAFFAVLGLTTLAFESVFALNLFSRAARRILPLLAAGMHLGILLLQNFIFLDAFLLQAVLWRDSALVDRAAALLSKAVPRIDASRRLAVRARPLRRHFFAAVSLEAVLLFLFGWAFRLEFYPVSTWRMFSGYRNDHLAVYERVWAEQANGERVRMPFEKCFPAPSFNPFVRIPAYAFDPRSEHVARGFLEACAAELNRGAEPPSRIVRVEVERWRWDFSRDRKPPPYGEVILRRSYEVAP